MEYARLCATTRLVPDADIAKAAKIPPAELSKAWVSNSRRYFISLHVPLL